MKHSIPFVSGEYFLIPSNEFNELMQLNEVSEAYISVPCVTSDAYLKDKFGFDDTLEIATIIVSFCLNDN
jgi:hypothetical protein